MSNSSELFLYTTVSFKSIEPLFFELSCTQTDRQTDTQTIMSTLKVRLKNRNYNETSTEKKSHLLESPWDPLLFLKGRKEGLTGSPNKNS